MSASATSARINCATSSGSQTRASGARASIAFLIGS
jgi:hypothetical protein